MQIIRGIAGRHRSADDPSRTRFLRVSRWRIWRSRHSAPAGSRSTSLPHFWEWTGIRLDGFLKGREVWLEYTMDDLRREVELGERLWKKRQEELGASGQ